MRDATFSSKAYGTQNYKEITIDGRVQFDLLQVSCAAFLWAMLLLLLPSCCRASPSPMQPYSAQHAPSFEVHPCARALWVADVSDFGYLSVCSPSVMRHRRSSAITS